MEKITELGTIKISDNVFERLVKESVSLTENRDTLAVERKPIIVTDREDMLIIEFHVVHRFGTSLRHSSKVVLDHMESCLKPLRLGKPVLVRMMVVAIKARRSVKRDLEFSRIII